MPSAYRIIDVEPGELISSLSAALLNTGEVIALKRADYSQLFVQITCIKYLGPSTLYIEGKIERIDEKTLEKPRPFTGKVKQKNRTGLLVLH